MRRRCDRPKRPWSPSRRVASTPAPPLPLHRQLYDALRAAILDGRLPAGARLPATRVLAVDLGLSRTTVLTAMAQLLALEGVAPHRGALPASPVGRLAPVR